MSATTNTATRWAGWYRASKRHKWTRLVESDDYGTAWTLLLGAIENLGGGESTVSQHDPNDDRRPR